MRLGRTRTSAGLAALVSVLCLSACGSAEKDVLSGWKRHFGPRATTRAVATGADGRIVIAGEAAGPVDFGDAGVLQKSGSERAYIASIDELGEARWTFATEGNSPGDRSTVDAVAIDANGDVHTLGATAWGTILNGKETPPSGFVLELSAVGAPGWNAFIVNATGEYPFNPVDSGLSIAVDASSNVIVAAACYMPAKIGSVEVSPPPIVSAGVTHYLCLFSLDAQGQPRWGRAFTSAWTFGTPRPKIAVDAAGNVLVSGRANNKMDLGAGPTPTPTPNVAYVLAVSPQGDVLWSQVFGGTMVETVSLGIDAKGRPVLLIVAGGDLVVDGAPIGGGTYTPRSVLVWLDPNGKVLARRSFSPRNLFDTIAVGQPGIAMVGTHYGNEYAPTLVAHCPDEDTSCKVGDFGEAWTLYRDVAWHADGDIVVAGTLYRETETPTEEFAAVGKFHFE